MSTFNDNFKLSINQVSKVFEFSEDEETIEIVQDSEIENVHFISSLYCTIVDRTLISVYSETYDDALKRLNEWYELWLENEYVSDFIENF